MPFLFWLKKTTSCAGGSKKPAAMPNPAAATSLCITTGTAGGYAWEDSRQFRYFGEFGERMGKTLQNRQGLV